MPTTEAEDMDVEARLTPFRLKPQFAERPWGRPNLRPWYPETGTTELVGEAWLSGPECVIDSGEHTGRTLGEIGQDFQRQLGGTLEKGEFPLLVKMLFPQEKLSVQVHPNDEQARAAGLPRGKTECWYVVEAEPGATIALGLRSGVSVEDIRAGVANGTVEDLLEMLPVAEGDMIFVDAGTVHAIGKGVVLLEVQQSSDVTYRLFDYGRGRELHLEQGLAVLNTSTEAGKVESRLMDGFGRLIEGKYFVIDRFDLQPGSAIEMSMDGTGCVVGLTGKAAVNEVLFEAGQAVIVPDGSVTLSSATGASFLRCWEPGAKT